MSRFDSRDKVTGVEIGTEYPYGALNGSGGGKDHSGKISLSSLARSSRRLPPARKASTKAV
jgi:hypothetical protein